MVARKLNSEVVGDAEACLDYLKVGKLLEWVQLSRLRQRHRIDGYVAFSRSERLIGWVNLRIVKTNSVLLETELPRTIPIVKDLVNIYVYIFDRIRNFIRKTS
jgi:hypothetical protein